MAEYIEREALKQALLEKGFYPAIVKSVIENTPTADVVEVRSGKWKAKPQEFYIWDTEWICSNCKEEFCMGEMTSDEFLELMKYCPNCGAKMTGKGKDPTKIDK